MFDVGETTTGPEDPDGQPDLVAHHIAVAAQLTALLTVTPDATDGPGMAEWVASMANAQASLDGLQMAVTAAFDASGQWALDGVRSPVAWLVDRTAVSRAAAGSGLKTARLARSMAHVSAAALAGQLCGERVRWLTRARTDEVAERFDQDEAWLVSQATTLDVDRLRVFLLTWRLRALEEAGRNEPDGDAPTTPGEQDRINLFPGVGGRGVLDGDLTPESRAVLFRAVAAEISGWHRDGALAEDTRSQAELNADALLAIVKRGCLGGTEHGAPRPLLIALADLDTIARLATQMAAAEADPDPLVEPPAHAPGTTTDAEPKPEPVVDRISPRSRKRCEVVGVGPIPEQALRRLLGAADISLVVVGADGHPVAVRRTIRFRRVDPAIATRAGRTVTSRATTAPCLQRAMAGPLGPIEREVRGSWLHRRLLAMRHSPPHSVGKRRSNGSHPTHKLPIHPQDKRAYPAVGGSLLSGDLQARPQVGFEVGQHRRRGLRRKRSRKGFDALQPDGPAVAEPKLRQPTVFQVDHIAPRYEPLAEGIANRHPGLGQHHAASSDRQKNQSHP